MKTVCKANDCNSCTACLSICPKKCIMIKDEIRSSNAVIDLEKCIHCGLCERVCPNIHAVEMVHPIKWKQGWAESKSREKSSSGGVASAFISSFIENGGYVASCLFNNGDFAFELTNDPVVSMRFAGSKYVKSNALGIFDKIKECLTTNKVLFIGLPCQVAALKNYIKDQRNLYTIDIICHGTPSKRLLSIFLSECGYDINSLKDIQFRKKSNMGLQIDSSSIGLSKVMDDYTCAFLSGISYTDNCYSCQFATIERVSDITLGDSWGTELKAEEGKGVSLILIQTEKGIELLGKQKLTLFDVDLDNAIANNAQLVHPSVLTSKRERFLCYIEKGKSFKNATLLCIPKLVLKQKVKSLLLASKLYKSRGGGYGITIYK